MYAGLDFGTSNCLIGIWKDNAPSLLPLEGQSKRLPSALYTSRDNDNQTISEALLSDTETAFGEAAILRHIEDSQSGYFIKSPKSFLGADIRKNQLEMFSEIITRMMLHIKRNAENAIQSEIEDIVIGRPVNFHGTRGEVGNRQAISVLEKAALEAGYKNIEFLMEPMAAALDFERSLTKDVTVLVLDAGGGTTDCSMVKLGPSYISVDDRADSILGHSGDRVGGTDLDIKLAVRNIMPYFGKDSLLKSGRSIPVTLFWDAMTINDVNTQTEFLSPRTQREIASFLAQAVDKEKFQRFQLLQEERLMYQLNRSAELAKIGLSESNTVNLPLDYIENDLFIPVSRNDLRESIERELDVFISLMKEVENQAATKPDLIYVTGGTAKSPVIEEWIRSHYGDIEIVVGDAFGSVVSGLTTWAHRIYQ